MPGDLLESALLVVGNKIAESAGGIGPQVVLAVAVGIGMAALQVGIKILWDVFRSTAR